MQTVFWARCGMFLLGVGALQASPILGPPVGQCSAVVGVSGSADDLIMPYSTWTAANFACEQQDKIYSNFSPGLIPGSTTLRLQVQTLGSVDFHTVTFNGNFLTNFSVSYDVAVDATVSPATITSITGDLSNPTNLGTPSITKTVFTEAGALIGTLTSTARNPGVAIATNVTALHAVDDYSANGGAAVSVSNTFREDIVLEPFSFALVGGGFGLLALAWRIRRT
jgi:hypothetical protein